MQRKAVHPIFGGQGQHPATDERLEAIERVEQDIAQRRAAELAGNVSKHAANLPPDWKPYKKAMSK